MTESRMLPDDLRALRKQAKMTQQEVADALFVNVTLISRWETGKAPIAPLWRRDLEKLLTSVIAGEGVPQGLGRGGRTNRHIMRRTETQMLAALGAIDRFIARHERPPTFQELANALFYGSLTVARNVVTHLVNTGYLHREPFKARTMRITDKGKEILRHVSN